MSSGPTVDYYSLLGVRPTASLMEIEDAYYKMRDQYDHYNTRPSHDKDLKEAWATLSDSLKRDKYNRKLREQAGYSSGYYTGSSSKVESVGNLDIIHEKDYSYTVDNRFPRRTTYPYSHHGHQNYGRRISTYEEYAARDAENRHCQPKPVRAGKRTQTGVDFRPGKHVAYSFPTYDDASSNKEDDGVPDGPKVIIEIPASYQVVIQPGAYEERKKHDVSPYGTMDWLPGRRR